MSCKNQKSNTNAFPVGVLSCGQMRTQFDLNQMKQFDRSNTPNTLLGKKEGYCGCKKTQSQSSRTLAWDDPDNRLSYNMRY
jgi:hypothetical protein